MTLSLKDVAMVISLGVIASANAIANVIVASPSKTIPFKQVSSEAVGDPYRMVIAFAVCLLALAGVIYILRKRLGVSRALNGKKRQMRVVESQRLGARSSLHVVEFAGKRYLLAQTEQHINRVASAPLIDIDAGASE